MQSWASNAVRMPWRALECWVYVVNRHLISVLVFFKFDPLNVLQRIVGVFVGFTPVKLFAQLGRCFVVLLIRVITEFYHERSGKFLGGKASE